MEAKKKFLNSTPKPSMHETALGKEGFSKNIEDSFYDSKASDDPNFLNFFSLADIVRMEGGVMSD